MPQMANTTGNTSASACSMEQVNLSAIPVPVPGTNNKPKQKQLQRREFLRPLFLGFLWLGPLVVTNKQLLTQVRTFG